jgi:mRNA-degrading endonuclease YafQ of YafQ-DinJ toxin-antitoxin module
MLKILITRSFSRVVKKMHERDKQCIDEVVNLIATHVPSGEEKVGDLAGVFVYKFKLNRQDMLLAYKLMTSKHNPVELVLLALGRHENFYAHLKNDLHP